jgi:outer membrane protein assembly factor BamB
MHKTTATVLGILLLAIAGTANAQAIAEWRGTDRKGVYQETNLLTSWPETGPPLLWKLDSIGNGYCTPVISGNKLYMLTEKDSLGYLLCYDLNGKLLWKSDYGREWVKTYIGSRSSATVAKDFVYTCSGLGNLCCFDANTGKRIWFADKEKDLHGRHSYHGHSESPVILDDMIYLTAGGVDTNVVALNRFTGKVMWVCKGIGEPPAYHTPALIKLPARNLLVTFSAYTMLGIDAKTGELLWKHDQVNTPLEERKPGVGETHCNSVWFENGNIYYIAGDGNGAVKLKLSDDGKSISQLWRNDQVDNFMSGFIKQGDFIYSCSFGGKDMRIINATSGATVDSLKVGRGAMIMADNLLYYYTMSGDVRLINPNNGKPLQVSSFKISTGTKEHFAHPVIDKGIMYIRHGQVLLAYDIRKK